MIPRKEKLGIVLRRNIDKVVSAKQLEDQLLAMWNEIGFSSARSLALYMRRYKFKKVGRKYLIEEDNINNGEAITDAWKKYFKSGGLDGNKKRTSKKA